MFRDPWEPLIENAPSERTNLIINGDFSVAQRGTSFTSATWRANSDDSYLLDRWLLLSDGNDIVDVTQISGAFSRSRYALQAEVETANKKFGFCQIVEANSCIPLRGQKISVSFAAKTVSAKLIENVRIAVLEWTSTADQVTSDVVSSWTGDLTFATNWAALNTPANHALTTSEQTFKVENLTVGSSCNNLAVFVWCDDTDCAVDDILQLSEFQVVRGAIVPEFVANSFADEYNRCVSRFFKNYPYAALPGSTQASAPTIGQCTSVTWALCWEKFISYMAVSPTIACYHSDGTAGTVATGPEQTKFSSVTISVDNTGIVTVQNTANNFTSGALVRAFYYVEAEL